MANPTTNFGWVMPTSTDLVTDLPADFAIFGQAVDTSMAELKGGTTGQVLSKTSNTDMDFTWVAQDDSNAIQNAIVDAKGDLITATAADTPARLAVGTNGQTLVADSTASTGLKWATPSASAFVGVYAQTTTTQSIANATYTVMNIGGTDVFDTNSFHDTTTNNSRVTIPSGKAGYYLIIGAIAWKDNATGERQASLKKNGTIITIQPIFSSGNAGGGNFTTNLVVYIANLAVSDYIEIQGRQYSGGSLGTEFVQLTAQYLGA